jgi:hypothetical protein
VATESLLIEAARIAGRIRGRWTRHVLDRARIEHVEGEQIHARTAAQCDPRRCAERHVGIESDVGELRLEIGFGLVRDA